MNLKTITRSVVFVLAVVVAGLFGGGHTYAAEDPTLVVDPDTVNPSVGSDIYAEISKYSPPSNNLNAPKSYAKLSFNNASGNQFRISYCRPGVDRNCFRTADNRDNLYVRIWALNESDGKISGTMTLFTRPQGGTSFNLPNFPTGQGPSANGRYSYLLEMGFAGSDWLQSGKGLATITAFRIRAVGAGARAGLPTVNESNFYLAMQNRSASTPASQRDTFRMRFRTDCSMSPSGNNNFIIRWTDADATVGSSPYNPEIWWSLTQRRRNGAGVEQVISIRTSDDYRNGGSHTAYMGGQGQSVSQRIDRANFNPSGGILPGDVFEWVWGGVAPNNGIQFNIPFDDAALTDGCAPRTVQGTCEITSTLPARVGPSEGFDVTFRVTNTGSVAWPSNARIEATSSSQFSGSPVTFGAVPPGGVRNQTVRITAPSQLGSPKLLSWALRGTGLSAGGCDGDITVAANTPYLHVSGADVISGASFASSSLDGDDACAPTDPARHASIVTNGAFGSGFGLLAAQIWGSSRSQYAVLASGSIGHENDSLGNTFLGNYGYYRASVEKDALFAYQVDETVNHGHYYGSLSNPPLPCIDIRSAQDSSEGTALTTEPQARAFITGGSGGTRTFSGGTLTLSATNLIMPANGTKKTLIVNGDVIISGNISAPDSHTVNNIPSLRIIARNVYIPSSVSRVDASIIAVPSTSSSGGIIDTCSNVWVPGQWDNNGGLAVGSCSSSKLTFGGQVIGRRILLKRTFGTLGLANTVINDTCYFGNVSPGADPTLSFSAPAELFAERSEKCAAEAVNFNPAIYLNRFNAGSGDYTITSTSELPPIY